MVSPCASREDVYKAMFALVEPLLAQSNKATVAHPFLTVTRKVIETQRIDPLKQPVLMQFEMNEENVYSGRSLTRRVWTVVYILGVAHKADEEGASLLNPLIDAVEARFKPVDGEPINLGGLVESVQLVGSGGKDHGDNSTKTEYRQAAYYLPVQIISPSC